jgi:hypothetical protein
VRGKKVEKTSFGTAKSVTKSQERLPEAFEVCGWLSNKDLPQGHRPQQTHIESSSSSIVIVSDSLRARGDVLSLQTLFRFVFL